MDPNFVHPKLFLFQPNSSTPIVLPSELSFNPPDLTKFISQYTNFYYKLPGLLSLYNQYARSFQKALTYEEKSAILYQAKEKLGTVADKEKTDALSYINVMSKALDNEQFIVIEKDRLEKINESKSLSTVKKNDIIHRINILNQFLMYSNSTNSINDTKKKQDDEF